jgi:ribosome maturation factor RimP
MISKSKVEKLIAERIAEHDPNLFVVELKISSSNVISVELDKMNGNVSVEDCIKVSRNIEHNLDREKEDFELNVSSAGLDKGFRVLAQYRKNVGREVKVKLNEGGSVQGVLKQADNDRIVVETTRKEKIEGKKKKETIVEDIQIPMGNVKDAKVVISFK